MRTQIQNQAAREPIRVDRPSSVGRLHIDLSADWEVLLWTREFGCSVEALRAAVKAVGTRAHDVRAWLRGDIPS